MVLTVYFVISPVIGLSCHRYQTNMTTSAPGRADIASAKLDAGIEASGPHDFTVRNNIVRLRARARSRVGPRPAIPIARRRCRVHRIPCPTSVTIAKRPSFGPGPARHANDLRRGRSKL